MKMRGIAFLLMLILVFTTIVPIANAETFWAYAAYTTANVNVRTGPGTNYQVVTTLAKYTEVKVTAEVNGWSHVETKGNVIGYIRSDLLSKGTEDAYVGEYSVTYKAQTSCKLYLRKGPGTNYDAITLLSAGKSIEVIGEAVEWLHVKVDGQKGYVCRKYIIPVNMNPTVAPANPSITKTYCTTTKVYFREGPSTDYVAIKLLKKGEIVNVLGTSCNWYKVAYNGQTGYIYSKYLEKLN